MACIANAEPCYVNASPCIINASPCIVNASPCIVNADPCYVNAWACIACVYTVAIKGEFRGDIPYYNTLRHLPLYNL